jgi:hypothetical protein
VKNSEQKRKPRGKKEKKLSPAKLLKLQQKNKKP